MMLIYSIDLAYDFFINDKYGLELIIKLIKLLISDGILAFT